jgi:hypothetical protein
VTRSALERDLLQIGICLGEHRVSVAADYVESWCKPQRRLGTFIGPGLETLWDEFCRDQQESDEPETEWLPDLGLEPIVSRAFRLFDDYERAFIALATRQAKDPHNRDLVEPFAWSDRYCYLAVIEELRVRALQHRPSAHSLGTII